MRKKFVEVTSKIFIENGNTVLLLGDIGIFSFKDLADKFPTRVINNGIMEQTMVGFAAGLSKSGFIPIIHSIGPFIFERALEQIKIDFAYQQLGGNLITVGASYDYSGLGPTHHGPADIPTLFNVPNCNLFTPGTSEEFSKLFYKNYNNGHLNYFRLSEYENNATYENEDIIIKSQLSNDFIIVVGCLLDQVLEATRGLDLNIIYINSIQKFSNKILKILKKAELIITIEPYYPGTLLSLLNQQDITCKIKTLGVKKDLHNFYGKYEDHLIFDGLDHNSIRKFLNEFQS